MGCASATPWDITIVYTTSVEGEYESCGCPHHPLGGVSKRAKLVEDLKKKEKNLVVIDSGDLFFSSDALPFGSNTQWRLKAELIGDSYKIMGVDAIGVGEKDLAMGLEFLKTQAEKGLKIIATNLSSEKHPWLLPYLIIEKNHKKIGIISLLQGKIKPEEGEIKEPIRAMDEVINTIRNKTDLIVLLSHLKPSDEENLLKSRSDIEIIISSHMGYISQKPREVNRKLILSAGNRGKYAGVIRLKFNGKGPYSVRTTGNNEGTYTYESEWIPIEQDMPSESRIDKLIAEYNTKIAELNATGKREIVTYITADGCKGCHEKQYQFWKSTKHAMAYQTLKALKKNMDPECIPCHTTGFGKTGGFTSPSNVGNLKGVQCESCHENSTQHGKAGGRKEVKRAVPEIICRECHTPERSPDFDYNTRLPAVSCPKGR